MAILLVALVAAGVVARGCGSQNEISDDRAVELAKEEATFTPERHQVRFLQRGIPARGFWAVSLYNVGPNGRPTRTEVYVVDAKTGDVTREG